MRPISDWFHRFINDPQAVVLVMLLLLVSAVIMFIGRVSAVSAAPVGTSTVCGIDSLYTVQRFYGVFAHRSFAPVITTDDPADTTVSHDV
jgi:hypothetical protein